MTFPLTVEISPPMIGLRPGEHADVDITIGNVSDIVEHYEVTIEGLPSEYYKSTEASGPKLKPGQSTVVRIGISLPAKGGITSGKYVLGVLVASKYTAQAKRATELTLDVAAISEIEISTKPQVASGRNGTTFAVSVVNQGNKTENVSITALDDQAKADFTYRPIATYVAPGPLNAQVIEVHVRGRGPLAGQERRSTITFSAQLSGETRAEAQASFVQPPLISGGLLKALGLMAAVLVIAGSTLAGYLYKKADATAAGPVAPNSAAATNNSADPPGQETTHGNEPATTDPNQSTKEPTESTKEPTDSTTDPTQSTSEPTDVTDQPVPRYMSVANRMTVAADVAATGSAECPEGTVVLGGGADVQSEDGTSTLTAIQASSPEGGLRPRRWLVSVQNLGSTEAVVDIKATCAQPPPGYVVRTQQVELGESHVYGQAECEASQVVLGGGGGAWTDDATNPTAATDTQLLESRPLKGDENFDVWKVAVRNSADDSLTVEVQAICAAEPKDFAVPTQVPSASSGGEAAGSVPCPPNTKVLSGGAGNDSADVDQTVDPETTLAESTLIGSVEARATGWSTVVTGSGTSSATLTFFAVCGNLEEP